MPGAGLKTTAVAVIAALLSFFIGNVWIFISAEMFVNYFYEARAVALAHVFTLGWVSLMIVGVLRQLGPVAFGLNLRWSALVGVSVAIWIPALIMMIAGFVTMQYGLAAAGTSVLFAAIVCIVFVFLSGFQRGRLEPPHYHLIAGLLYFVAAAFLGGWMGLAKGLDLPLPAPFHRVLFSHIHLAGAGWAGMLILAVLSRLFPQPHLRHPVAARVRVWAFHIGLIGLIAGLLSGGNWYPVFGSILAGSLIWYALAFISVIREFSQPSDRSSAFLITSWSCLIVVATVGLWFNTGAASTSLFTTRLQFVYGFIYLFGWLSFMIVGMLYRIIPTHLSKLFTARGVSSVQGIRRGFIDPETQVLVLAAFLLGLGVSSAGILIENVFVFRAGWAIWLAGLAGFVAGLLRLGIRIRNALRPA